MRFACLAQRSGARCVGLERAENAAKLTHIPLGGAAGSECVLLANQKHGGMWPLAAREYSREEVRAAVQGARVYCLGDAEEGWIDLSRDERYLRCNAILTAEGAIYQAMGRMEKAICRSRCLIVGHGRIGESLNRMLRGLGAEVSVCARREVSRQQARLLGARVYDVSALPALLSENDVMFNTVPQNILSDALLPRAVGTLIIDLAGAPGGFSLEKAREIGLNAWRESGLPGRYCPESAGEALWEAIERRERA